MNDSIEYSCVEGSYVGTGNVEPLVTPFATGTYLLSDDATGGALCQDIGSNAAADDTARGYPVGEMDWRDLSARSDQVSETTTDGSGSETVDAGIHDFPGNAASWAP